MKKNRCFAIVLFIFVTFFTNLYSVQKENVTGGIINNQTIYSPEPFEPYNILFDYYHHSLPSTKVGNYITTGSWVDDKGRYGWDDFVHTNTFDPVYIALEK